MAAGGVIRGCSQKRCREAPFLYGGLEACSPRKVGNLGNVISSIVGIKKRALVAQQVVVKGLKMVEIW